MPKFLELVLDLCPLASYIYSNSNSSLIVWTLITESIPSKRLVKLRLGYSLGTTWVLWLDLWWLVAGSAVEAVMGPMLPLRLSWLKLRPNCKRLSARSCQLVKMPNCQIKTKFSSKQSIYLEKSSNQREFAPLLRRPAVCHITDSQQWPICHKFECHKPFRCLLGLPNPTTHPPPESWPTDHGLCRCWWEDRKSSQLWAVATQDNRENLQQQKVTTIQQWRWGTLVHSLTWWLLHKLCELCEMCATLCDCSSNIEWLWQCCFGVNCETYSGALRHKELLTLSSWQS